MVECCMRLQEYDLAINYYRKAHQMNPRDVDSISNARLLPFLVYKMIEFIGKI